MNYRLKKAMERLSTRLYNVVPLDTKNKIDLEVERLKSIDTTPLTSEQMINELTPLLDLLEPYTDKAYHLICFLTIKK